MKPYTTTTIENILPGMIVRAKDRWEHQTTVLRVDYTFVYETGGARIGGRSVGIEVEQDAEIAVLHDPTQGGQEVWTSANMPWDDNMTEIVRRNAEQALAYHKNRGRHDG